MKELFGPIRAEEELKNRTRAFLAEKIQSRTGERRYRVCAAACACMLLMALGGCGLYFTPTARISIDINPSIELSINRLDRVISVDGFNEDGRELSDALNVKHKNYAEAVGEILNDNGVLSLLSGGEVMIITVIGPDGRQSAKLLSGVELCAAEQSNTHCYFAQPEEVAPAHESGLSCGKYRAFLELRLLDPDITPETVRDMTMREIWDMIDRLAADRENETSSYGSRGHHGYGGGHGNGWGYGRTEY